MDNVPVQIRIEDDACKNLGADDPEYIVHGEDIMVKFTALRNAKVLDSKALNVTKDVTKDVSIEVKILALIKENASITTTEMANRLFVNRRTVQRGLDALKGKGKIERKGGKRNLSPKIDTMPCQRKCRKWLKTKAFSRFGRSAESLLFLCLDVVERLREPFEPTPKS